MADIFRPFRSNPPALRKGVVIDTVRGSVRVRKWPKARGKPRSRQTQLQNEWFADIMRKLKYLPSDAVEFAIQASKGTGLYPRDVLMMQLTKSNVDIEQEDGTLLTQRLQGVWQVAFQGIRLQLAADQAGGNGAPVAITWPIPPFDTVGMWTPSHPERIIIPGGVKLVRLTASVFTTNAATATVQVFLRDKDGESAATFRGTLVARGWGAVDTGPYPVAQGDYFYIETIFSAARTLLAGPLVYFACEVLEATFPPDLNTSPFA
jgi:hypothetical protein